MIAEQRLSTHYNFGFIDEGTKREIRRKLLKAVAVPGYQVPYSSPEMPIARGWGTGGMHVTLSVIGREDTLKVIDQGSDASVNACSIRQFVSKMTGCATTVDTAAATVIQTRHRIPEEVLTERQLLVFQVPQPEVLRTIERMETRTRQMHAEADYARMWVSLYESYVKYGSLMRGAGFPVKVHGRYLMSPSPIPRWDVPKLSDARCLHLFGAGREKRLYAVPPHTRVEPLEFEDVRFRVEDWGGTRCAYSGQGDAFLDEIFEADGSQKFIINDSNFLDRLRSGERPPQRLFQNPPPDPIEEAPR